MEAIARELAESIDVKRALLNARLEAISRAASVLVRAYRNGGKAVFVGNGGSAADAQHLAAELVGRFKLDRPPLPALALTTNASTLTAIGNDLGYDDVFSRQVAAMIRPGDVLLAISTSGNSRNIVEAARAARARQATVIALTGQGGGKLAPLADILLDVPSANTPRVQEAHITIGHILCGLVEQVLFGGSQ